MKTVEEGEIIKGFKIGSVLVVGVLAFSGIACTSYTIPGKGTGTVTSNSCEGCHTDYERLIAVHSPDTAAPDDADGTALTEVWGHF